MKILVWLLAHPKWNIFLIIILFNIVAITCYSFDASLTPWLLSLAFFFSIVGLIQTRINSSDVSDYAIGLGLHVVCSKNRALKAKVCIAMINGDEPYGRLFSKRDQFRRYAGDFEKLVVDIFRSDDSDTSHALCLDVYLALNEKITSLVAKFQKSTATAVEQQTMKIFSELSVHALNNVKKRKMLLEQRYGSVPLLKYINTPLLQYQEHLDEDPNAHLAQLFEKAQPTERQLVMMMASQYEDESLLNRLLDVEIEMAQKVPENEGKSFV